jgi:hypothetical protein
MADMKKIIVCKEEYDTDNEARIRRALALA